MASALTILRLEICLFTVGVVSILGFRLLTGGINTNGLLNDKINGAYSPARLQLLLFTLASAIYYAIQCYQAKASVSVPELAAILGGSNAFYVLRKFFALQPGAGS